MKAAEPDHRNMFEIRISDEEIVAQGAFWKTKDIKRLKNRAGEVGRRSTPKRESMWYVIWTAGGREELVRKEIIELIPGNFYERCFIPRKQECRRREGKWVTVEQVLFPCYLFIETRQVEEVFTCLKRLPRFAKLLRTERYFTPVTPQEEAWIRKLTEDGECVEISSGIIENQKIRITSGPLQGMEGLIRRIDRHKRKAWLHMEMFGRIMDICVGLEIIEKI